MVADKKAKIIEVPQPELWEVWITIEGVTPLLTNRFTEDDLKGIQDKQGRKGNAGRAPRDPDKIFRDSLYSMNSGGPPYGFPASGVKKAMAAAGYRFASHNMTEINGAINVLGDLLKIEGSEPYRDSRYALLQGKTATVAHRGCFDQWSLVVPIRYNASAISVEQILNLMNLAGFSVGIGAYRPEKKGTFGQFRITKVWEVEA